MAPRHPPKPASEERTNKKAQVIALKCARGAILAEIVETTGWQKHTVPRFRLPPWELRAGRRSSPQRAPHGSAPADGKKFLVAAPVSSGSAAPATQPFHVIVNWTELMKR